MCTPMIKLTTCTYLYSCFQFVKKEKTLNAYASFSQREAKHLLGYFHLLSLVSNDA